MHDFALPLFEFRVSEIFQKPPSGSFVTTRWHMLNSVYFWVLVRNRLAARTTRQTMHDCHPVFWVFGWRA